MPSNQPTSPRPLLEKLSWVAGIIGVALAIIFYFFPRSADSDGTKIAELTETTPEAQFLLGDWWDQLRGRVTFRKHNGRIQYKYVTPGMPSYGLPAVNTGFTSETLALVVEPNKTWSIMKRNTDGSQTYYSKLSNEQLAVRATDTGIEVLVLSKC